MPQKVRNLFKTPWTKARLIAFRRKNFLTQGELARLLCAPQQRISEWETGVHEMKRPYAMLLDMAAAKVEDCRARAKGDPLKYARLMKEAHGIEINFRSRFSK